VPRFGGSEF
jgi:hypothetical protein